MATLGLVEYPDAPPEVRAVYDDIMGSSELLSSRGNDPIIEILIHEEPDC
jgi:hypothetical protein